MASTARLTACSDLLVGGDGDAGEAARRGELRRREEQSRLPDAGLAFEGDRGEAAGRFAQLLGDRVDLGTAPDDRARRAAQLDGERALGPDERVERAPVDEPA
jgi:hypothetical protein